MIGIDNKKFERPDEEKVEYDRPNANLRPGVNPHAKFNRTEKQEPAQEQTTTAPGPSKNNKMVVIAAVAVVAVLVFAFIMIGTRKSSEPVQTVIQSQQPENSQGQSDTSSNGEQGNEQSSEQSSETDPNSSDLDTDVKISEHTTGTTNDTELSDSAEYVKDLQGQSVPVHFTVEKREIIYTHVNYVAKRATVDDGMEMYWLEVEYNHRKYRLQTSYYYFKDLDTEGIIRVGMEVLSLTGGGQLITYMQIAEESTGSEE